MSSCVLEEAEHGSACHRHRAPSLKLGFRGKGWENRATVPSR